MMDNKVKEAIKNTTNKVSEAIDNKEYTIKPITGLDGVQVFANLTYICFNIRFLPNFKPVASNEELGKALQELSGDDIKSMFRVALSCLDTSDIDIDNILSFVKMNDDTIELLNKDLKGSEIVKLIIEVFYKCMIDCNKKVFF